MKKNDREFDTYYDDEEDITGPVEDTFYDSFSGARHKVKVIVICRFRENNQLNIFKANQEHRASTSWAKTKQEDC